jgi:hypothetical protein
MISASATEIQKDLDRYVREAAVAPVEVKHGDDARSYLISERFLRDLLSSYRRGKASAGTFGRGRDADPAGQGDHGHPIQSRRHPGDRRYAVVQAVD